MGNHWSNLTDEEKSAFMNAGRNLHRDTEETQEPQSRVVTEEEMPTREDIAVVLKHLPSVREALKNRRNDPSTVQFQYSGEFHKAVRDTVNELFKRRFMFIFDHMSWMDIGLEISRTPHLLASADLMTIRKIVVLHWRQDYWDSENEHWEFMAANGELLGILERLQEIYEEMSEDDSPSTNAAEKWPTTEELVAGFEAIRERITPQQMKMLQANYHSEGRGATMSELAAAAGYDSYKIANIQYGSLAKRLYQAIGFAAPQSKNTTGTFWVLGIGEFIDRREEGLDMLCVMRAEVAEALEMLGFVTRDDFDVDILLTPRNLRNDSPTETADSELLSEEPYPDEDEEDETAWTPLTLDNCEPFDLIENIGEEMDLMDNPMGVAWRVWLHPDAYNLLKSSVGTFDDEPYIYEENGHEYVKVFDNQVIPFVIHMRIAGLDDSLPREMQGFDLGNHRELDPEFPVPTAQRNALAAHGMVPVGETAGVLQSTGSSGEPRYIQSCVTSIGFPSDFDELEMMFEKWEDPVDHQYTDLEVILKFNQLGFDFLEWTAARWMTEGDVLFFYHTNRGHKLIRRMLREFRETPAQIQREYSKLGQTLERNLELSTRIEGCIFACALVEGSAQYHAKLETEHFKSRNFVPFTRVHVFENPLHSRDFGEHFRIGQNTVTPLYRRNFGAIRDLLARNNDLPDFLRDADVGELIFQNISSENWRDIASSPQTRFLNEELVREYFIDYLLDEIRDPRTPILEECVTWRNGQSTGRADYFVKIGGRWIPVEAKLNIHTERDLLGQVGKYLRLEKFVPTIRQRRTTEFSLESHATCIVIDQSGVYLTHDQNFVDCDFGRPWLARENVTEDFQDRLRQAVLSLG